MEVEGRFFLVMYMSFVSCNTVLKHMECITTIRCWPSFLGLSEEDFELKKSGCLGRSILKICHSRECLVGVLGRLYK